MFQAVRNWVVCGVALAAVAGDRPAFSEESTPAARTPSAPAQGKAAVIVKNKRAVVPVRSGSAKDLAAVLSRHFQGEAEIQAAPESTTDSLLISAVPAVFDEIVATLAQLDHRPQRVIIDVLMADVLSPHDTPAGKAASDKELSDRDFAGPIEQVTARLEALSKEKRVANFKQLRVETLENRQGQTQASEEKRLVSGFAPQGTAGVAVPTVTPRQVGAVLQVTPRVIDGNRVLLELVFRNDRPETEDGIHLANGIDGPIIIGEVVTANLTGTLAVPVGQAVVVSCVQADGKSKRTQTRIIVAARIAAESPPAEKQ